LLVLAATAPTVSVPSVRVLLSTLMLSAVPYGVVTVSFTASMMLAVTVTTLLSWVAGAVSLVAPVVAVKITAVAGSSVPPAVPGAV
jgi:hypothetical protein